MLKKNVNLYELKLSLLEAGGVDNWNGYEDALSNYKELNDGVDFNDAWEMLSALEAGKVENWQWYDESLGYFGEYEDYLDSYNSDDEVLAYEDFVADLEEKERKEAETTKKVIKETEELLAHATQQTFYNLPIEQLEFPNVFKLIESLYPTKTHIELKDAYKLIIDDSNLFSFYIEEVNKVKKEAIKKGHTTHSTFFGYARPRYIELLIKNKKLITFIKKTLES